MPVKHGLLALLAEAPAHGYQLKADFEARTGGSWQLNIGQVYTTLQRLERDGLVEAADADTDRIVYRVTDAGLEVLGTWYGTPIVQAPPPRDELAIKVMFAIAAPDVDHALVLQRQRSAIVGHLQTLTRHKARLDPDDDLPELLHLDAQILRSEAEVRWLDTCEARLRHRAGAVSASAETVASEPSSPPHQHATSPPPQHATSPTLPSAESRGVMPPPQTATPPQGTAAPHASPTYRRTQGGRT
jgi:DNA-binding PadR family transcriptional regulator